MSDNIFSAVLTFSLLAGGTAAIGSEMFGTRQPADGAGRRHAEVTVTAQRAAPVEVGDDAGSDDHRAGVPSRPRSSRCRWSSSPASREAVTVAVETRASEPRASSERRPATRPAVTSAGRRAGSCG